MKKYFLLITFLMLVGLGCSSEKKPVADIGQGATISGLITVAQELQSQLRPTDVVFVIAKKDSGPPLAVKKIMNPTFPLAYVLTGEDAMFPGTPFQGEVKVIARVDRDGNAGPAQPGDLEGVARQNPARVGDRNVDIVINQKL